MGAPDRPAALDWTRISDDPNNRDAQRAVHGHLGPLVDELRQRGFNVRWADATSNADRGERMLATTPSPVSCKFFHRFRREGTAIVNLDHLCWVTPAQAMELARRADLVLCADHLAKRFSPARRLLKRLAWRFTPAEYSFPDVAYEFSPRE